MSVANWLEKKLRPPRKKRRHRARPFAERFAASLSVKSLESRVLLSASTELMLDAGGNLVITDVVAGGHNDDLTIQAVNDKLIISDPTNEIGLASGDPGNIAAHATVIDAHTIEVDAAAVGGQIIADLGGGDDRLTLDFTISNFSQQVNFAGGAGSDDQLSLIDGSDRSFSGIDHTLADNGSGTVSVAASSQISYDGVEQLADELIAVDRSFDFEGGAETITFTAGTTLANRLETTLGGAVEFDNPTTNLTISTSGAGDTLHIAAEINIAGTTTLNAASIELDADITGDIAGSTATTVRVGAAAQIQDGIVIAASGATVTVDAGTHSGDILVDKSLTLRGANAGIDPNLGGRGAETTLHGNISIVAAGPVAIDGFEINGSLSDPGADLLIENNIIVAAGTAIDISGANSAVIRNNVITAGGDGIFGIGVTTFVTIAGNTITLTGAGNNSGVFLEGVGGNVLIGGPAASDRNTIGGSLMAGVFATQIGGTFTARNNEIIDASEIGISIANFEGNATVSGNTIRSSLVGSGLVQGIYVSNFDYTSSASATVQGNTVEVLADGIWIESVQGAVQVGGTNPGEANDITAGGRGLLLLGHMVMGTATVRNNLIVAGSSGIEIEAAAAEFIATGNTITAEFEAGIRVNDSTANVTIGGAAVSDQNTIVVTNAVAGIAVTQVTGVVTIQGNEITSDANTSYSVYVEAIDGSVAVTTNNITTSLVGLYIYGVTGDAAVQANLIEGDGFLGMEIGNVAGLVQIGGPLATDGNVVANLQLGIVVGDSPNVVIHHNSVTAAIQGIYAYTIDALDFANNAVEITDAGTGVVFDGQAGATNVTFGLGNSISGGDTGLLMLGADVSLLDNTLSDLQVSGQAVAYITLAEGAFVGQEINGTGVKYGGTLGEIATLPQGFDIEDKIIHAIDDGSVGFVRVQSFHLFVTPDSFIAPATSEASIQRGINVAVDGDTIFVKEGIYTGDLLIDRGLTLSGPNAGVSAVDGGRILEAEVDGTITIATPGEVIIDGFTLNAVVNDGISNPDLIIQNNIVDATGPAIDISLVNSAVIVGNRIGSNESGGPNDSAIIGVGVVGDVTVQGNSLVAADRGIDLDQVGGAVFIGGIGIEGNTIFAGEAGIVAHNLTGTITAQGNYIDGFATVGVEVVAASDEVALLGNTVTSFAAGSQGFLVTNVAGGATLQGNLVEVDGTGVTLESVIGIQQIGGFGLDEGNVFSSFAGTGVLIQANGVAGAVNLENNQITTGNPFTSGGPGVAFHNGFDDFNVRGNTITSVFAGGIVDLQAAILIQNSSGNVTIGGLDPSEGNLIGVVDGFAGIEVLAIAGNLTIQNNVITCQSLLDPDDPLLSTSIYADGVGGTTTIQRNFLDGSEQFGVDIKNLTGTVTIGGLMSGGSISVHAMNAIEITSEADYLTPGIDAGVSTILLMANQDGNGDEGFTQDTAAPIETVNESANAIIILVGGEGNAAISVLKADTVSATITIDVGGAIFDNRDGDLLGDDTNITAHTAVLLAETGIGIHDDPTFLGDIDTAVSFLTGETTAGDIDIDELDDIELGNLWAFSGAIWVNSNTGAIDIQNGAFLQSNTGKVSNAPPLLRLDEVNPNDVIIPGDPTQEVTGTIGGDELLGDNLELGENFTLTAVWDDGTVSVLDFPTDANVSPSVTGSPSDAKLQAGDTIVWLIDENNNSTATIVRGPVAEGPINITIQRTYSLLYLQTVQEPEVVSSFAVANDPNIVLTDATLVNLNETVPLLIPTALAEDQFGQVVIIVTEEAPITFDEPVQQAYIETTPSLQGQTNIYAELSLVEEEDQQEVAVLFLVRVRADGSEAQRVMLPLSDLRDLSALLERLKKAQIPSGLYRIYYQEPGLPPQKVLEFRKTASGIGDPVREPGRGENPADDQAPAGDQAPAAADEAAPAAAAETPNAPGDQGAMAPQPRSLQQHVETALSDAVPGSFSRAARQLRRWQR